MAWPTETIIALITLVVACVPLLIKLWFYVKRKLQRKTPGIDLLPLHRSPSNPVPRTLAENHMDIPGLLINLNQLERSIDMQIFTPQNVAFPATNISTSVDNLDTLRRITTGLSSISV